MSNEIFSSQEWQAEQKKPKKKAKYKNIQVVVDGFKFPSQAEGNYYLLCKYRYQRQEIKSFERQKTYKLEVNGVLICRYRCDFVIHNWDGTYEVIDVKSSFTAELSEFKIKRALMWACHQIVVKLIIY